MKRTLRFRYMAVPEWVLLLTDLPHAAFRLYCMLLAHADGDGRASLEQKTLVELMGYGNRSSLGPPLRALQAHGLVEVEEFRYGPNNSRRGNIYVVRREPQADWEGLASVQESQASRPASGGVQC